MAQGIYGIFIIVFIFIFIISQAIKILREYERGVIFRLGRLIGAKGPGLILLIPIVDKMLQVSMRTVPLDVPPHEIITKDNVTVKRNAVAYVPEDRVPEIELEIQRLDDYLHISVADNGIGIPPDQRDEIFKLFYRAQPTFTDGSGVGLAVVKRVVDAAHGTITVSPRSAGGTVVTIDLPLPRQSSTSTE